MELIVKPYSLPEVIEANFDELKTAVQAKADEYSMALYGEDELKIAKQDRATLNTFKKALNDERIRLEKEYMQPFNEFKGKVNEIISIVDKPIAAIDCQIKEYDERRKEEKAVQIQQYMNTYRLPYNIKIERIFDTRWLNASVSMSAVQKEIDARVMAIQEDIETLEQLDEYQEFALVCYSETLDLRATLNEIKKQKEYVAAQQKIEEERNAKQAQQEVVKPDPKPEEKKPEPDQTQQRGQWIDFSAFLTNETAKALKTFLHENGIPFRRIIAK